MTRAIDILLAGKAPTDIQTRWEAAEAAVKAKRDAGQKIGKAQNCREAIVEECRQWWLGTPEGQAEYAATVAASQGIPGCAAIAARYEAKAKEAAEVGGGRFEFEEPNNRHDDHTWF